MPGIKRKDSTGVAVPGKELKKRKVDSAPKRTATEGQTSDGTDKKRKVEEIYNTNSSKEAHQKQRALAKERKLAKPNADSIQRAKKIWERLRIKSQVPKDERTKLVAELFDIVTGRVQDFVFKHDSVRTVECALKYATPAQRQAVAKELKGEYKALAQSRYAKFLVGKILIAPEKATRSMVVSEFYGHVKRLINHPEASWILDDTYRQIATPAQKATLLREWYGPEFAMLKQSGGDEAPSADLLKIIADSPEKRRSILEYLYGMINQLVQKKLTGFTMLHDAMLQYSLALGDDPSTNTEAYGEFLELLKGDEEGDLLKNLAFTASGSRVVCRMLAMCGAKDRKLLLRVYKDHIETLACDANGINVVLAAYEVVDDTVMTSKLIFPELLAAKTPAGEERQEAMLAMATHPIGRVSVLYPFASTASGAPKWLIQPGKPTSDVLNEVRKLRVTTSKKDPEKRREELAEALSTTADGIVVSVIVARAGPLVADSNGCQYISELLLSATGVDKHAAMEAVADLARGDPNEDGHMAKSAAAGHMLKVLSQGGKYDVEKKATIKIDGGLGFSAILWDRIKGHLAAWATGDRSFTIVALVEDEDFDGRSAVKSALKQNKKGLKKAADGGNRGAQLLLGKL